MNSRLRVECEMICAFAHFMNALCLQELCIIMFSVPLKINHVRKKWKSVYRDVIGSIIMNNVALILFMIMFRKAHIMCAKLLFVSISE